VFRALSPAYAAWSSFAWCGWMKWSLYLANFNDDNDDNDVWPDVAVVKLHSHGLWSVIMNGTPYHGYIIGIS